VVMGYTSETVSAPSIPSGPTSGAVGASYTYSTGGSYSNLEHSVQYFFDWGDGTNSEWLPVGQTSALKSWTSAGAYLIEAKARCSKDTSVVSFWSEILLVTIGTLAPDYTLTVTKRGTGTGTVSTSPAGIDCGTDCKEKYAKDTLVTLTAEPDPNSSFTGWTGACIGTSLTCEVKMSANKTVRANFVSCTLTVSKKGTGTGTVSSSPGGIDCGADCKEKYAKDTLVTLTASPEPNSVFAGWSGAYTGTSLTCQVKMGANRTVTSKFVPYVSPALTINGVKSSTKKQGESFSFKGSNYTSQSTVTRHMLQPDGSEITLTPTLSASSSGTISWSYTSSCSAPTGTYTVWVDYHGQSEL
jgi:hypothetical protein